MTIVGDLTLDRPWGYGKLESTLGGDGSGIDLFGLLDLECIMDVDRKNLIEIGYHVDAVGRWLSYNTTFNITSNSINVSSPFLESLLGNDCLYIIDQNLIQHISYDILQPFLAESVNRGDSNDPDYQNSFFNGTDQLLDFFKSGNVSMASIDEKFARLAQALTLWVRANGDEKYSRPAEGEVLHYAVCVRVTWAWISLPAALAGLTLIMLVLTVATTARRAVPVWKLFPLAVLLCGPAGDDWVDRDLLSENTSKAGKKSDWNDGSVDGMSTLASMVSVQLLGQDGRYQLRQVRARSKKPQY